MSPLSFTPGQWQFGLPGVGDYTILLLGQGPVTLTVTSTSFDHTQMLRWPTKINAHLPVGQSFLLFLGNDYTWNATADDPAWSVVCPTCLSSQALRAFPGRQPGHTTLTATGDPACRQEQPPCAVPSMVFSVQIVVQ